MRKLRMVGAHKKGANEPPFTGQVLEADDSPTDLTGILGMEFRLGTPGSTPDLVGNCTLTDAANGEWEFKPTLAESQALPIGDVLVHVKINWTAETVEYIPFDHYFQLHILDEL